MSPRFRTPVAAVWSTAIFSVAFTVYAKVYSTIAAVCVIFLYLSYVLPTALGFVAHGRTWTKMGPFTLGRWYRPLAAIAVIGCLVLLVIGVQPPNDQALWIVLGCFGVAAAIWFGVERRRFAGPPVISARTGAPRSPERARTPRLPRFCRGSRYAEM